MVTTKIVYDRIFIRFDGKEPPLPEALTPLVQTRETHRYHSGRNRLSGYLYRAPTDNARQTLVVVAPGFRISVDHYLWQIKSLLDYGWSVFAFDATGSCTSSGASSVGFSQELCDMEATLQYIEDNDGFGYENTALLGHSRGGYAVCGALRYNHRIAAAITVSGINSAMEAVIGSAAARIGPLAYGHYAFLWLYQAMLFGPKALNASAEKEINKSGVPVLVIHGTEDKIVPFDRYSIISHRPKIASSAVQYVVCGTPRQNGHTDLLFEADGTANRRLMEEIHRFLMQSTVHSRR